MGRLQIDIPQKGIEAFCKKWRVKEFSIFGSALRDDVGPKSDVDILVELQSDHGLGRVDWVDMTDELRTTESVPDTHSGLSSGFR